MARRDDQERTDRVLFGVLGIGTSELQRSGTLARAQGWNPTKASIPLRSIPAEASVALSPVVHFASFQPHSQSPLPSPPQPFPLRNDLTRRCRGRDAEHVAQGARWHGRAPRADCGAHVGACSVRRLCKPHAIQRRAHHATCLATHLPHDAVRIGICRAAHRQRSCQLALLGRAESAQHARATQQ
jgi:hypothetical protein